MKFIFRFKRNQVRLSCVLFFSIWVFSFPAFAQKPVTGKVTDEKGNALRGVSVTVKNTSRGTMTNEEGVFSIGGINGEILELSMIGFKDTAIALDGQTNLDIILQTDVSVMGEVVLIGYGAAKRKDAVGAINTISGKDFGNTSATQPVQLLLGKAPGLQVVNNNGVPGIGANVIIRGTGSFTTVAPLFIIDGIQSDGNIFNAILPQDIESITILKDAASIAIYGASGANGIIIITTRAGKPGTPKISFSSQWGLAKRPGKLKLLNAEQYLDLAKDFAASQGITLPPKFNSPDLAITRTDWQDAIFHTAVLSSNAISINGGSEKVLYNVSLGYINQEAIEQDYQYRAANLRFSVEERPGIFRFGQSVNIQYQYNTGNTANLRNALYMPPYFNIYDPTRPGGFSAATNVADLSDADNPLATIYTQKSIDRFYLIYPQFFGEVNILKSLKFRSQIALKFGGENYSNYQKFYRNGNNLRTVRSATEEHSAYYGYLVENFVTWDQSFGIHHMTLTAGNSYINKGRSSYVAVEGTGIANDDIQSISVAVTNFVSHATAGYANPSAFSYFGRLVYTLKDKYVLSASIRRDGSSIFGDANKFGNFPGIGFAWNASDEAFLKKIKSISSLRVRIGWGKSGNSNGAAYQTSATTYSGNNAGNLVYSFGPGEEFYSGTTTNSIPNPLLKWEETVQTNIGLDLGLFKNLLNVSFDLYNRKNNDLLVSVPVPNSSGFGGVMGGGSILSNAASVVNKGIEIGLTYKKTVTKNFTYSIGINGAYNKNKVISLGSQFATPIRDGSFDQNSAATYTAAGFPIGSFYGYRIDHVAINQADIDKYDAIARQKTGNPTAVYQTGAKPGDFLFKDLDGDGLLTDKDQQVLGDPLPKFIYGGNLEATYQNFDLNLAFAGADGLKIYDQLNYTLRGTAVLHNTSVDMLNRWRQPGDIAKYPRAGQNSADNLKPSDFYTVNGSFMRIKTISFGYNLPNSFLNSFVKGVFNNARVYISLENLVTLTSYSGYDPEISARGSFIFARGVDNGQLPQPKSFLAGLQIGF